MTCFNLCSWILKCILVLEEILVGKSFNVVVSKGVSLTEHSHFIDILEGHSSFFASLASLILIFLVVGPLKMIIKEILSGAGHFPDREKSIRDVFH